MIAPAVRLLIGSFSRRNAAAFGILFILWVIIQIPLGLLLMDLRVLSGWLKPTLFNLLWPGLLMPFFYAVTYRIVLAEPLNLQYRPLPLLAGFPFWPVMLRIVAATFAGRLVGLMWAACTGGLGWHQFPTLNTGGADFLERLAEALAAQTSSAAAWVVTAYLLIGLPGIISAQNSDERALWLEWRKILPPAIVMIFALEALLAATHVLHNSLQYFQYRWRAEHDAWSLEFPTYAISAVNTYLFEFLHAFLLFGTTAVIYASLTLQLNRLPDTRSD